jgi:hypothetical protein
LISSTRARATASVTFFSTQAARAARTLIVAAVPGVDRDHAHPVAALALGDRLEAPRLGLLGARACAIDHQPEGLVVLGHQRDHAEARRVAEREAETGAVDTGHGHHRIHHPVAHRQHQGDVGPARGRLARERDDQLGAHAGIRGDEHRGPRIEDDPVFSGPGMMTAVVSARLMPVDAATHRDGRTP